VLTAAHCIHSGGQAGSVYANYRVIPGRNLGAAPFGRCGVRRAFVLSGWAQARTPAEARYYDLGALKLDCDIGARTGWFGVRATDALDQGAGIAVQGYAADLAPTGRQWRSEDTVALLWALKGFHRADTFGGTSGAPVSPIAEPGIILGVHTNGFHGEAPWASHNAFTRITPQRLARIRAWIEG
jgi:putative chitinase